MMHNHCELTVLMAINRVDSYTKESIESILSQSYSEYKFVIVCNGENANEVAEHILKKHKDSRINTLIVSIPGLANALNFGLSTINTKYIARMDADDISLKNRFKEQIAYLEENPNVGVLGCKVDLINESDKIKSDFTKKNTQIAENITKLNDKFIHLSTHKKIVRWLPVFNSMCHPALMFRTKCLQDIGGYKYGFHSEDHELFIRISRETGWEFANLENVLLKYRRHNNQITGGGSLKIFSQVAGFLIMHFLKSGNILFLFGVIWVSPPILWIKKKIRAFIRLF